MGALLVLLIALVAFTLVFTEAVPLWMAQNETGLEQQVQTAFAQLQATVDVQDAFGTPLTGLTSIGLTSSAVPILASPTQGSLLFVQDSVPAFVNVSVEPGAGGTSPFSTNVSMGELSATLPNRYIPSEVVRFESGAVFVAGTTSSSRLLFQPLFSLARSGPNTTLAFTIVSMTGPTVNVGAPGTQQIADTIVANPGATFHGSARPGGGFSPFLLTLRLGSVNACAWATFFGGAASAAGIPSANVTLSQPSACSTGAPGFGIDTVTFDSLTFAEIHWLTLSIDLEAAGA